MTDRLSTLWSTPPAGSDPLTGLKRFFEELPGAVVSYSIAIGALSFAAILLRAAVNIFFGV